ncbi:hypothetical protein NKJ55_34835, partial [Mesorhizobium sp. M0106]|uniref:hypothetical protein n=1 Tax=Mesorhizobium sp. M0106 TaxID=2956880 RepID=UPI00333D1C3B
GSGPMWIAIPSSQWTSTTYSLPVSRRTKLRIRAAPFSQLIAKPNRSDRILIINCQATLRYSIVG